MKKLRKAKPAVLGMSVMIGVALLAVYCFASEFIVVDDDPANQLRQVSDFSSGSSGSYEEERSKLFLEDDENLYAASRGNVDRSAGEEQSSQPDREEIQPFEKREIKQSAGSSAETAVKMPEPGDPGRSETLPSEPVKTAQPESAQTAQLESIKTAQSESVKAEAAPQKAESAPPAEKPVSKSETVSAGKQAPKADSGYASDLDLLARLITAEAQGEPYEAKVAVGAVVMNRVQSGSWPATIQDVIYQKINGYDQFTPVANGWINKPAEAESIKAAAAALKGADPTGGAEFYYDDSTTNSWILGKPVSVQIGSMIYAF